jgi:hypothetical protein
MSKTIISVAVMVVFLFALSACNIPAPSATPDVNAAYTQVAQTFEARRTREAQLTPSASPSPSPTRTATTAPATITATPGTPTSTVPMRTNTQPATNSADRCTYIGQNIADNSSFLPGAPVAINWTLKNTGTNTWSTEYTIRFYAGDIMGGTAQSKLTKEVKPDENYDVSMALIAPLTPDTYNTVWVVTSPAANGAINFCSFYLIIKVSN